MCTEKNKIKRSKCRMKKIISMLLVLACLVGVFSVMSVSAAAAEPNADVKEMSKMLFQNVGTSQYLNFDYIRAFSV